MSKVDNRNNQDCPNVDFMRSLVKQYSELGQWTSAFFWADAAAAAGGGNGENGDDIWLLASTLLAQGEVHRASHAVVSRGLHRNHLLCLGVAMRAHLAAKEPTTALSLFEECEPLLLEPRCTDQTHNRALAGVLVTNAHVLSTLERREAAAEALASALKADVACYEALDLLLEQHALTPRQERELIESLPINSQLSPIEGALVRAAYRERLKRYSPLKETSSPVDETRVTQTAEEVRSKTAVAASSQAHRLIASCKWKEALKLLDSVDPWVAAELRAVCLLEMKNASELFVFAHSLVNAYPNSWKAWFAVGCYYYLIGKSDFARRYLSKAKSLDPSVGCIWLAYGHSFAADKEHDQAMAAYFKACQLMPGCYLPPLYVGVECSLLHNVSMAQRFLLRASLLYDDCEASPERGAGAGGAWARLARGASAAAAHEGGVCAARGGSGAQARGLLAAAAQNSPEMATTLDALGHVCRKLGRLDEALTWHEKALSVRPGHPPTYTAIGLVLALKGQERKAADVLHAALAKDPDDAVALALLDVIVDNLDSGLDDEDIPQFPFPAVNITPKPVTTETPTDQTNTSDMSMSFD